MAISRGTLWRVGLFVLVIGGVAAAWKWTPLNEWTSPERLRDWIEPHRSRWYSLPLLLGIFVLSQLVLFPVLALVFVCGLAFGAWPGCGYAMLGTLVSAVPPYYLGRWIGRERLIAVGGTPARKAADLLRRRGLVAVFLVRKVPAAPYSAVNMLCGACEVRLPDFLIGTFLGMATGIVLITVLGAQFVQIVSGGDAEKLWPAVGVLAATLLLVLPLQYVLNRRLGRAT